VCMRSFVKQGSSGQWVYDEDEVTFLMVCGGVGYIRGDAADSQHKSLLHWQKNAVEHKSMAPSDEGEKVFFVVTGKVGGARRRMRKAALPQRLRKALENLFKVKVGVGGIVAR
jgi:hypothetical protein